MKLAKITTLIPACVLALAACTSSPEPEEPELVPSPSQEPGPIETPSEAEREAPEGETRTVSVNGGEAEIEVGPLAIDGDTAVLRFVVSAGKDPIREWFNDPHIGDLGPTGVQLIDADNGYVHDYGWAEGAYAFTDLAFGIDPGESYEYFIAFAAPDTPEPVALIPHSGFFLLETVEHGATDFPSAEDLAGVPEADLSFPVSELRSYSEELGGTLRTREADDVTVLTVSADVLFAKDSADLSEAADAALERAARKISGGGELTIIGHTDDVGTHEHNQALSEDRARSVAAALEEIVDLAEFDVAVEGRAYDEPAVVGTTEEARAENRRVEITFTPAPQADQQEHGGAGKLPEPLGPVGRAGEVLEVVQGQDHKDDVPYDVRIDRLERIGNYLAGHIELTNRGEEKQTFPTVFAIGPWDSRGDLNFGDMTSATRLTLADGDVLHYPLDYPTPDRNYNVRGGDTTSIAQVVRDLEPGESTLVPVMWPGILANEVILESPWIPLYENQPEVANRGGSPFRILDLPIVEP